MAVAPAIMTVDTRTYFAWFGFRKNTMTLSLYDRLGVFVRDLGSHDVVKDLDFYRSSIDVRELSSVNEGTIMQAGVNHNDPAGTWRLQSIDCIGDQSWSVDLPASGESFATYSKIAGPYQVGSDFYYLEHLMKTGFAQLQVNLRRTDVKLSTNVLVSQIVINEADLPEGPTISNAFATAKDIGWIVDGVFYARGLETFIGVGSSTLNLFYQFPLNGSTPSRTEETAWPGSLTSYDAAHGFGAEQDSFSYFYCSDLSQRALQKKGSTFGAPTNVWPGVGTNYRIFEGAGPPEECQNVSIHNGRAIVYTLKFQVPPTDHTQGRIMEAPIIGFDSNDAEVDIILAAKHPTLDNYPLCMSWRT